MEKILETDFSEIYLNDEDQSLVIKFKEKEDYPHFKVLFQDQTHLAIFFKTLFDFLYEGELRGRIRSEGELRIFLEYLIQNRKRYLKDHGGSVYSRKLHHYINMLEFVLGDSEKEKLGGFFIFFDKPKEISE